MTEKIVRRDSEEGRTYETPEGELKSVTTYLSLLSKPWLVAWAAKTAAEYFKEEIDAILAGEIDIRSMDLDEIVTAAKAHHKKKSEEACEYGSEVHKWITDYFSFGSLPEDQSMQKLVVAALSKITGELGMKVSEVEKTVYYRKQFAGTLDLIGQGVIAGQKILKNMIVDIKTGHGRVYDEAFFQVSAYALAEEYLSGRIVDEAVILPLNKDTGEAGKLVILPRVLWRKYAKAFLALVKYDGLASYAKGAKKARKKREVKK